MYQEPTVFEDLTVAENVFAGRHLRTRFGTVDWGAMRDETARILGELAVGIDPDTPCAASASPTGSCSRSRRRSPPARAC